jgi:hypothetical protein
MSEILEYQGMRFALTGEKREPRDGDWFIAILRSGPLLCSNGVRYGVREILRIVQPDEKPAKQTVSPALKLLTEKIRALHGFAYTENSVIGLDVKRVISESIEPLIEQCSCVILNARIIPDPQMKGSTDTCAVPFDDVEGLQEEAGRWMADAKHYEIRRWEKPE